MFYISINKDQFGVAAIPITVRQLEAVVRLAESRAKMELARIGKK